MSMISVMKKCRKKCIALVLSVSAAFSLVSCGGKDASSLGTDPEASAASDVVTSAPAPVSLPVTTSEPPDLQEEKYRMKQAVTCLDCFADSDYPLVFSIGGGKLASVKYANSEDATGTVISAIDIMNDEVVKTVTLDYDAAISETPGDGLVVRNNYTGEFVFYNSELEAVSSFEFEEGYGYFSKNCGRFYCMIGGDVCVVDTHTGVYEELELSEDISLMSYAFGLSPDDKYLYVQPDTQDDGFEFYLAAVDTQTGELAMLSDAADSVCFGENYTYFTSFSDFDDDYVEYATGAIYRVDENGVTEKLVGDEILEMSILDRSDWFCGYEFADLEETDPEYQSDIPIISAVKLAVLQDNGQYKLGEVSVDNAEFGGFVYIPEGRLLAYMSAKPGEDWKITVIDPEYMTFDGTVGVEKADGIIGVDKDILKRCETAKEKTELPERLAELRSRADKLEQEYGVTILISAECKDAVKDIDYFTTDEYYDAADECHYISAALYELEESLKKYPKDMFGQFKNALGKYGLRIVLTAYIKDDFSAAYTVWEDDWYNMVFDIAYSMNLNFPHEMWHSIEQYINMKDYRLLSDDDWAKLNPKGFVYSGIETYLEQTEEYTYLADEDWYFYDIYAKANEKEDKARIMEVVMSPDIFDSDGFVQSEHIQLKLKTMSETIRAVFDTENWEAETMWEKYLR